MISQPKFSKPSGCPAAFRSQVPQRAAQGNRSAGEPSPFSPGAVHSRMAAAATVLQMFVFIRRSEDTPSAASSRNCVLGAISEPDLYRPGWASCCRGLNELIQGSPCAGEGQGSLTARVPPSERCQVETSGTARAFVAQSGLLQVTPFTHGRSCRKAERQHWPFHRVLSAF